MKMPRLTLEQRIWICKEMSLLNNASDVLRRCPASWPDITPPTHPTIKRTYNKFCQHGTCLDRIKGISGRRRTARSLENVQRVQESLTENGKNSSRRNGLNMTKSTFNRITKELHFHPYVLIKRQKLREDDPDSRLAFCNRFLQTVANDPNFLDTLIVLDEAIFSLNSEVNTKNVIQYSVRGEGHPEDHYVDFEKGAGQLMVWMGVTRTGAIFGPHFVEGNLDQQEYIRIIRYHVIQRDFREQNINRDIMWWQQDGAPAHTSNRAIQYLRGQFPGRLMSKRGDWPWPPRSPDLTVCDFFLWGYLKHAIWNVPRNLQPQNLQDLCAAIIAASENLPV